MNSLFMQIITRKIFIISRIIIQDLDYPVVFKRNLSVIDKIITEFSRINNNMSIESILDLFDKKKLNPRKIAKLQMQNDFTL